MFKVEVSRYLGTPREDHSEETFDTFDEAVIYVRRFGQTARVYVNDVKMEWLNGRLVERQLHKVVEQTRVPTNPATHAAKGTPL